MKRLAAFSQRNAKEILRDPLTILFSLGFPVVLLVLLSAIQRNVPVDLFRIETLAPGITVFGLTFMTLFSATLIAKDRESAFLQRLYTTPLTAAEFILGYLAPLLPIGAAQTLICYGVAALLGLQLGPTVLAAALCSLPASLFFILLGLLCGSVFTVKQVGGICGALLTNLTAWLSGIWFDLALVGGAFQKAAQALPFYHAVALARAALAGSWDQLPAHLAWVTAYLLPAGAAAILLFLRQMKRQ